jgi:N-acetylneuraminic acid mutarotase
MTSGWFYAKAGAPVGHEVGPLSWEELYVLAQRGTLGPGDLVWNPRLPRGVAAGQIPGLFLAPAPTAIQPTQAAAAQPPAKEAPPTAPGPPPTKAAPAAASASPPVTRKLPPIAPAKPLPWDLPAATPLKTAAPEPSSDATEKTAEHGLSPDEAVPPPARSGRSWLPWLVVVLALVIAAGGLVAYFLFLRDTGDEPGGADDTATTLTQTTAPHITATTESAAPAAAPAVWAELDPAGDVPAARDGHSLVYDPDTGKVILFGGSDFDVAFNDTWAYDPPTNTWTKLSPAGSLPSKRMYHQMVYDPAGSKMILFGGIDSSAARNDTWAYDPAVSTWSELHPAGDLPAVRQGHALVYDPGSGRVILFGGWDDDSGQMLNDTWAYDPTANSWTELRPAGDHPGARWGHAMVYDPDSGRLILFGGWDHTAELDDTWSYDPAANTWTALEPAGDVPPAREGHAIVCDEADGKIILFGGYDDLVSSHFNDTWAYGNPTS